MNELFRFVALRAPETPDVGQAIDLANPGSDFQGSLSGIHRPPPSAQPVPAPPPLETRAPRLLNPRPEPRATLPVARLARNLVDPAAALAPVPAPVPVPPPPPANPVQAAQAIAKDFIKNNMGPGGAFITDPSTLSLKKSFDTLFDLVSQAGSNWKLADFATAVQKAFAPKTASDVVADQEFQSEKNKISDSIIAIILTPSAHALPLDQLVQLARLIDLIERVANKDPALSLPGAAKAALSKTILLPATIFPLRQDIAYPRVGELLVVKQNLKRYELGEIANIENILLGETRRHANKHTLTMDRTLVTETEKTTETTTELNVTERFELKTEAENVIKEDISAKAGLSVSAKYGGVEINANADFAYSQSKSQTTKASVDHAKDVTSRAAKKVTERVRQQETIRTIEIFEETEEHDFDNSGPTRNKNISGVYQWVNKVYEAQIFNYGQRMLIDLMVPEPAAFLLDAATTKDQQERIKPPDPFVVIPVPDPQQPIRLTEPDDFGPDGNLTDQINKIARPITPSDLSLDPNFATYYGSLIAKYGAAGIKAPPEEFITVSKGITANKDQSGHLAAVDNLPIPGGYRAISTAVQGEFNPSEGNDDVDGNEFMWVFVGRSQFIFKLDTQRHPPATKQCFTDLQESVPAPNGAHEVQSVPVAVETYEANDFAVTIDIQCQRTDAALEEWKVETHAAILQAYIKQQNDYEDKRAEQALQSKSEGLIGGNPDENRQLEKTELKKACIAILTGEDLKYVDDNFNVSDFGGVNIQANFLPMQPDAQQQGRYIRFFEQAFEWEHMTYIFYQYFWGRKQTWKEQALRSDTDPVFAEFMKAGAARVVVPIRLKLEPDALFYLMTGQIWGGGGLSGISDSSYLPITEEIKARDDAPGDETPYGDPWDVKLPTTLIKLRDDDSLPIWNKFAIDGHDVWVPGRMQQGKWAPDYGKLDSKGNWAPQ